MRDVGSEIADQEILGRAIFDSRKAKDARAGKPIHSRLFREKPGVRELSVDRLSLCDLRMVCAFHDTNRGKPIQGWATLSAIEAKQGNTIIASDPIYGNKWHANIIVHSTNDRLTEEEQQSEAVRLANLSSWFDRPTE